MSNQKVTSSGIISDLRANECAFVQVPGLGICRPANGVRFTDGELGALFREGQRKLESLEPHTAPADSHARPGPDPIDVIRGNKSPAFIEREAEYFERTIDRVMASGDIGPDAKISHIRIAAGSRASECWLLRELDRRGK